MEEEIKERIALGNKVYFANKNMFQSKLISKRAKLKLYYTVCLFSWRYNPLWLYFSQPSSGL
jgi:hypothetical protein